MQIKTSLWVHFVCLFWRDEARVYTLLWNSKAVMTLWWRIMDEQTVNTGGSPETVFQQFDPQLMFCRQEGKPLVLSFSGCHSDDEAVLKWSREKDEVSCLSSHTFYEAEWAVFQFDSTGDRRVYTVLHWGQEGLHTQYSTGDRRVYTILHWGQEGLHYTPLGTGGFTQYSTGYRRVYTILHWGQEGLHNTPLGTRCCTQYSATQQIQPAFGVGQPAGSLHQKFWYMSFTKWEIQSFISLWADELSIKQ